MQSGASLSSPAKVLTVNDKSVPEDVQELASKLFDMARNGDTTNLAAYVDNGVDPNLTNQDGNSLLMLAAYAGHHETLDALISRGANVNQLNGRGQSPLAGAVFKQDMTVVEKLLNAGAFPHEGHPNAIDTARMFGLDELAATLSSHGA